MYCAIYKKYFEKLDKENLVIDPNIFIKKSHYFSKKKFQIQNY